MAQEQSWGQVFGGQPADPVASSPAPSPQRKGELSWDEAFGGTAAPTSTPSASIRKTSGITGRIGDWLIDNTVGGVSEDMLENARSGTFQQDAANDEGLLDFLGSKLERGGAWFDRGLYDVLGGLGSQKAREAANALDRGTVTQSIAGDVESFRDVDDLGSAVRYAAGLGAESLPSMLALAIPYAGVTGVAASQTGNIARERAAGDGRDAITVDDLTTAAPWAIASTALDKFGFKGMTNPAGNRIAGRIAGAAAKEGGTEFVQSGLEYAGGSVGTERGFDLFEMGDQMLEGGVAGAVMGAGFRSGGEVVDPVVQKIRVRKNDQAPGQGEGIPDEWEGSLDDLMRGDQKQQSWDDVFGGGASAVPVAATGADVDIEADIIPAARPEPRGDVITSYMSKARSAESGGVDSAKNPRSSATGRYQFIESTFKQTYKQVYGASDEQAAQAWATKRNDPATQEALMRRLTGDNAKGLQRAGIPVTEGNLYLAHFAGIGGAQKLHQADPNASAESVLGKSVVAANPHLKGMTASDVISWAAGKMGGTAARGTSGGTDYADGEIAVDIPGADGSMLGRGDRQERIARLDPIEPSGQDWRLPDDEEGGASAFDPEQPQQEQSQQRAPLPALPEVPEARRGHVSQVTTARGGVVDTQFEIRDLSELIPSSAPTYDQALQPRDRSARATSDAQVASIAANLDPAQLGDSRLASTGAPIIGPDGQVESGNGRVSAIALAYQQQPERAQAYRQMVEAQGFDTAGVAMPVLVRRRTTDMTPEQRQQWTRAANERDTMAMSSTEQASADARALPDATLALYRGGPVTAAANRDFVRAFIDKAVSPAERNAMTASDGSISADGVRRIRFALLARAYGDTELIARISEDTDTNIAAIGNALLDAAPALARLRAKIEAGEVPAQYDISSNIAQAAQMVARSRSTGQSIKGMLAQTDAFAEPTPPATEQILYLFFRDAELKRPRAGAKVADALISYANKAEAVAENERQGPDIFGNPPDMPSAAMLLQQVRSELDGDAEAQPDMLTNAPESPISVPDERTDRPDGQPAAVRPDQGEPDGGPDRAVPTLARGQLRAMGIAQELRARSSVALVGRTASTPKELAEIAQVYRDPRYETFRIFFTKGDEIVHATGVSSRSIAEAPLMPQGMAYQDFIDQTVRTMHEAGADGYYLLHNHPSGDPDPSPADKQVTRQIADRIMGFRGHVVINSNKFAEIQVDAAGRSRTNVRDLDMGEDTLLKPSVPHPSLGAKVSSGIALAILAKNLQKPGYVTLIGTNAKAEVRVIVEYPAETVKRDAKALMGMARRVMRQSGSAVLHLVGDREALQSPNVTRALKAGIITAAFDADGKPITTKVVQKNKMPVPPGRYVAEDGDAAVREQAEPFGSGPERDGWADKIIDKDGLTRDAQAIRNAVGKPVETLKGLMDSGFAEMGRAFFYTMDARLRGLAKKYDSAAIDELADHFHSRAGVTDKATSETYHEAVDREGFGRAGKAWRILEEFAGDEGAMERIGLMLRDPGRRTKGRMREAQAAKKIAQLLKDTIEYRKTAGEDIGEVTDGYFPRIMNVEKVVQKRDLFLRQATALYAKHGAENPRQSAEAWMARIFDQYAGLDGGPDFIDLFHDTRQAGVGRKTSKAREFGKDADSLLGEFYDNDTGQVLTAYFIGAARKAEEARRFGDEKLARLMRRIKADIRKSGEDAGDSINAVARMVAANLGRSDAPSEAMRTTASVLHTAGQLGTLDRATITSLSEAMMGFVRGGPKYGIPMLVDSATEFARQLKGAKPSEAGRMAEALGIAHDVMIGEALAARAGFERGQTTRRAQKVQQGFYKANGLHQWTEGTRIAATRMGGKLLRDLAADMAGRNPKRAAGYLRELGVKDPEAFGKWLREGGTPSPEQVMSSEAGPMERAYRTAMIRFVNQTIMKPTRAEKPGWASTPTGALFFSLLSYSYGFKKNVLDRTGRLGKRAFKEGDPSLLYPAFGLAGLMAVHTVINNVLRQAIFGGGREDDEEGIDFVDVMEAMDRAGLFGAASPILNAIWGLKYRRGTMESLVGPVVGRPFELIDKTVGLATDSNSDNTNTAERAAAAALYDVVLEPAMEAYAVTRFAPGPAAAVVWGSGNREGGMLPADRDAFIEAVAGPKE